MITIGIRVAPRTVTFAIYDSDEKEILNVEEIKLPEAFLRPDALKYARSNILDVLREYNVENAGVRITEPSADPNIDRVLLEGVMQEAFASSNLKRYYIGQISSISSRIGMSKTDFKPYVNGEKQYNIAGWKDMSKERREAVLTALGAVHA